MFKGLTTNGRGAAQGGGMEVTRALAAFVVRSRAERMEKFKDLFNEVLPEGQTEELIELCWSLGRSRDVSEIARAAARG